MIHGATDPSNVRIGLRRRKLLNLAAFRAVLFKTPELQLIPIELSTIEHAARIRAQTGLKAPDAIHAATAMEESAALMITNDPAFTRVAGLSVAVLSQLR